jgi:hypothetical protein
MSHELNTGTTDFGYQSWSWPVAANRFAYCDCVRNYGSRPLFVSWRKAGLQGWVRSSNVLYSYSTSAIGKIQEIDAPIWYGPQPTAIQDAKIVRPAGDEPKTQSAGAVGFPDLTNVPETILNSPAALTEYLENNPDSIKTMQMSFESKATIDSDTGKVSAIISRCEYKFVSDDAHTENDATITPNSMIRSCNG